MARFDDPDSSAKSESAARAMAILERAGLRATAQRMMLVDLLFGSGKPRHVSAERLYEEAIMAGSRVSLATVYNSLRALTAAGVLRQVNVDAQRIYFDTNTEAHQHIYDESTGTLTDIDADIIKDIRLPALPRGSRLQGVDLIIRVRS